MHTCSYVSHLAVIFGWSICVRSWPSIYRRCSTVRVSSTFWRIPCSYSSKLTRYAIVECKTLSLESEMMDAINSCLPSRVESWCLSQFTVNLQGDAKEQYFGNTKCWDCRQLQQVLIMCKKPQQTRIITIPCMWQSQDEIHTNFFPFSFWHLQLLQQTSWSLMFCHDSLIHITQREPHHIEPHELQHHISYHTTNIFPSSPSIS